MAACVGGNPCAVMINDDANGAWRRYTADMTNIIRPDFARAPFIAEVVFDPECSMWVVSCEELSVTTEAPSYEAMTARFWEIAPEIAELNGIAFDANSRVQFLHTEKAHSRKVM